MVITPSAPPPQDGGVTTSIASNALGMINSWVKESLQPAALVTVTV